MPQQESDMKPITLQNHGSFPIVAVPPNFELATAKGLLVQEAGQPQSPSEESPHSRQVTEDEEHDSNDHEQKYWRDWRRVTEEPPG